MRVNHTTTKQIVSPPFYDHQYGLSVVDFRCPAHRARFTIPLQLKCTRLAAASASATRRKCRKWVKKFDSNFLSISASATRPGCGFVPDVCRSTYSGRGIVLCPSICLPNHRQYFIYFYGRSRNIFIWAPGQNRCVQFGPVQWAIEGPPNISRQ